MIKLRNWFLADALFKTEDIFDRARINVLFNLLVAFTFVNIYTFIVDIKVGSSILEPAIIGIGILIYILLIFRFRASPNVTQSTNIFLIYQNAQPIIFGFMHTQNDGIDSILIGFTLMSIVCTLLLAQGKLRPYLIFMSMVPLLNGLLIVNGYNLFPMLVAPPREMMPQVLIVPLVLIIYVLWDFSRTEVIAKRNLIAQKLKIEENHAQLAEQHLALEKEQDKTQNMLHKIQTLFGQHVSEKVVKELVAQEGEFQGKKLKVTIMFLDIRDFTRFAASKAPEEVATFQNIVFSELIEIIRINNGITNQILGDGIMAVFGAPVENNAHTIDAVKAGYAILGKVNELVEGNKIPKIRIGIGLHTGDVVAGNIGNSYRKQYSLTGTTVNIASRIEQLNKIYKSQFLISHEVQYEIRHSGFPITNKIKGVELKGLEQVLEIYQLV